MAGCADQQRFYDEIQTSRSAAYGRWLGERTGGADSRDVVRGRLSVDECIEIALANNKQIAGAVFDKESARGKITESYAQALPKVDADGSYTRLDETPGSDFGGAKVRLGSADNYALGAKLSQPVYRGGGIGAGIRAARIYACMADERVREAVQNVTFDVQKTYCDVLLAAELLRVSEEAVVLSQKHVEDVQNRRRQGVASDYDVLRAKVEVSNYQAELIQNRNNLSLLKTSFYKLLGASQESDIEFIGPLEYEKLDPSLEEAVEQAFANRPELIESELQYRLYRENLVAAKAKRWPEIDVFFDETYARPDPHDGSKMNWGDSWTAGATLSFPLFDGFRNRGLIRQARADLEKSRIRLSDKEEVVLLETKQAVLNIHDAESFVESQQANVERAAEGLKLVEAGYREGMNTDLEVRDARQALLRARALYFQAAYSHKVAQLQLLRATGTLCPPVGQTAPSDAKGTTRPDSSGDGADRAAESESSGDRSE